MIWTKKENGLVIVGIDKESALKVKEFVFVKLPKKGAKVKKGEVLISLEAVKWSGHADSPVDGEVVDVNEKAYHNPSLINKDPENTWLVKLKC